MTLLPTRLESGEEYATVGAILAAADPCTREHGLAAEVYGRR